MARRSPRTGDQPVSISSHLALPYITLNSKETYTETSLLRHRFSTAASQSLAVSPRPALLPCPGERPLTLHQQADLDAQERVTIFLHRWDYICANWWASDMGEFTGTFCTLRGQRISCLMHFHDKGAGVDHRILRLSTKGALIPEPGTGENSGPF